MVLFEMMALGYSDITPKPRKERKLEKMIHWDYVGSGDYRTYEEVADFFKGKIKSDGA